MENTSILKRPKATDSEEDLFRMQEEFLKNKEEPSVKVINTQGASIFSSKVPSSAIHEPQGNKGKAKSRYSQLKKLKTGSGSLTSQRNGEVLNSAIKENDLIESSKKPEDYIHNYVPLISNVILGNIVEKRYDACAHEFKLVGAENGFPKVFVSDRKQNNGNYSLFHQQVSQKENVVKEIGVSECAQTTCVTKDNVSMIENWASEIHKENLEKLNQMSVEDVLQEKAKLEAILKPDLIQFLKDRGKKKLNENPHTVKELGIAVQERITHPNQVLENEIKCLHVDKNLSVDESQKLPQPPMELMKQAKEKGWVHMDSLEREKLKWMEDLSINKADNVLPNEPYNARFDFDGMLLPYKDDNVPTDRGLHHHGEEPERPGYSLQELLQLSRSSAQQQRCTALTTLANIIEKSQKGLYDTALQPAPLNALNQKNILLLLRFSLDDSSMAVITATLQALRAFLYNEADEVCLDRLVGLKSYTEPVLTPPKSDVNDISNLKDHELAQLDTIAVLLRSNILLRIRYILSEVRPPPIAVTCMLEILIRIGRHSNMAALNIASTPCLLDTIITNFMPLSADQLAVENINNTYGVPLTAAVKLCRILICYAGKPVAERLNRLKIVHSIISYISCDIGKASYNLRIESLRLWEMLLLHNVALDSVSGAQLILVSQLQLLLSNHDLVNASELSCEYAAALIAVASYESSFKANLTLLLSKWSVQLLLLYTPTWCTTKLITETLLTTDNPSATKELKVSRSRMFCKLCSSSNLLSGYSPAANRNPSSLPNLGVLTQDGQLQPIVGHDSCIPFLAKIVNVFIDHSFIEEIQEVLNLPDVYKYLKKMETSEWSLERSWFTRTELFFLTSLVKAAIIIKNKLTSKIMHTIWKICIKLIGTLPADCWRDVRDLLKIAFLEEKLNVEIMATELAKLNLNSNVDNIKISLNHNIAALYERYIISGEDWCCAAMPKDWIYLPLIHIYTKCRNNNRYNEEDKRNILTLLSLQLVLPDLVQDFSESLRFSRLVLVYLCDTLYLDKDVSILLSSTMFALLKGHHKKLNFSIDLPGLNSFTDLFTAMCEHFCSTSYGDYGFSIALLVPIAQRHNVHYRKLLWSEHMGLLRYLKIPVDQLVIPLKEYLYPVEEDTSLIESYITALVRETIKQDWCPVPYAIAVHHSAMYLKTSGNLAIRMKKQIEKLPNQTLANILLNYVPPIL